VSVKAEKTAQCVDQLGSGNNKSHTYHVSKKARESLPIALGGKKKETWAAALVISADTQSKTCKSAGKTGTGPAFGHMPSEYSSSLRLISPGVLQNQSLSPGRPDAHFILLTLRVSDPQHHPQPLSSACDTRHRCAVLHGPRLLHDSCPTQGQKESGLGR
jgi:hypothetical protein